MNCCNSSFHYTISFAKRHVLGRNRRHFGPHHADLRRERIYPSAIYGFCPSTTNLTSVTAMLRGCRMDRGDKWRRDKSSPYEKGGRFLGVSINALLSHTLPLFNACSLF